jgi:hypothetical protein
MIAFFLAELGDWRERHMRRTICLSAIFLAAIGLIGPLQPLILAIAITAVFIVSGWTEGIRPQPVLSARLDPLSFPARAFDVVAGKALAALSIWLGLVLALSPILAASAIAWGLSGGTIASCLACWLSAYLAAASANFCSKLAFARTEGLIGLCIYILWIFLSFFMDWLKPSNPFIQAWSILRLEGGNAPYFGICAEAGAAAALFASSVPVIDSIRRKRDA